MAKKGIAIIGIAILILGGFLGGITGWEMSQPTISSKAAYIGVTHPPSKTLNIEPHATLFWVKGGETITIVIPYDINKISAEDNEGNIFYFHWGTNEKES